MNIANTIWLLLGSTILLPYNCDAKNARDLFDELNELVYQIQVIDVASGDKSSIGSGFQIEPSGRIATNFHVVSQFVHEPQRYRLEVKQSDGISVPARLHAIDVIHDLALLQATTSSNHALSLSERPLAKGERVFSMGNPQDLGMTIVEGNYNGLIKTSRRKKFLFSGSLNAGMSGGPALDSDGAVIGVNVSKQGEQLSFLVPASALAKLLTANATDATKETLRISIRDKLLADQDSYYDSLLKSPWRSGPFGDLALPRDLDATLRCWGHTVDDDEIDYQSFHQHCQSQNEVFLRDDFRTGRFFYDYEWLTSQQLNRFQFYAAIERRFNHRTLYNAESDKHTTKYKCHTDHVDLDDSPWKVSVCFRAYKEYVGLHDALLLLVSVGHHDRAAIIKVGATGVGKDRAFALFTNYLNKIAWIR